MNKVSGLEKGFNLPKHMAEHIYMFCGESIPVKVRTNPKRAVVQVKAKAPRERRGGHACKIAK